MEDMQNALVDAMTDQWHDRLRIRVHAGGGHFKYSTCAEMNFHLCGSSEHLILSMQFDAFDGYFVGEMHDIHTVTYSLLAICRPSGCTVVSSVFVVVGVCNRSQMRTSKCTC